MDHAWDHFDYTNDVNWWKTQGWPLVKVFLILSFDLIGAQCNFCVGCCKLSFRQIDT
jgi:hypothetical protein